MAALTACHEETDITTATATLELELTRAGRPAATTRAVDADLAIDILDDEATLLQHYAPGHVPAKIVLAPGTFTLRAYTDNQDTWTAANNGRGEPCYAATTTFTLTEDMVQRVKLDVPMTNYAVTLQLPQYFNNLFPTYTFTLTSDTRTITINEGQKAYFNANNTFTYALRATNIDGVTHAHSAIEYPDIEPGKLFTIRYSYDSDATSGGVDIVITDDMETDNTDIHL